MAKTPVPPPKRQPYESHEDYMNRIRSYRDDHLAPNCSMRGNMGGAFLYTVFGVGMILFTIVTLYSI